MTVLNDILIPKMKEIFHLNHTQAMLIQFCFFGAYFVGSLIYFFISSSIGDPINKIGYKNGIIIGLIFSAIGTFLFYPAAEYISYPIFLSGLFVLGLGFTLLQIAANPYIAIIGNPDTASSRLNLSQAFNSLGTTIAPIIGGFLIFDYFAKGQSDLTYSVKIPYLIFSLIFVSLGLIIKFIKLSDFTNHDNIEKGLGALKFPQLRFGIIAIFLYVGAEVSIGSMMISFLGQKEIAGLPNTSASHYLALYWGGLMIGRFIGAISLSKFTSLTKNLIIFTIPLISFFVIAQYYSYEIAAYFGILMIINVIGFFIGKFTANSTLFVFALIIIMLLITSILNTGSVAMWCVIGIGLFNSIMWSNIFTLSISGLGKYTSQGSSLLVMAILGGALIPELQGFVADNIGVHNSFIVPILSYIYLAFYGAKGYRSMSL